MRGEGIYADGLVTVHPLPEEVHGTETVDVQLRRLLDGEVLSESQAVEAAAKELEKACPCFLFILQAHKVK